MDPTHSLQVSRGWIGSLDESWQAVVLGLLVEKTARTGSRRTAETYGQTIRRFLARIEDPAAATPLDVHRFAYSPGQAGSPPSPSTVSVRLTAVGGLYDFACLMRVMDVNPAAGVRRPAAPRPQPRGLTTDEVARLLAVIPDTPSGLLDRALIVTALLTGLRRSEVVGLRVLPSAGGGAARYEVRTKGGAVRCRELPEPAWQAILAAAAAAGRGVGTEGVRAFPVSDATFYGHLRHHAEAAGLGQIGCHVLRHTAAKARRRAGASIEDVCSLLGHRSLLTTVRYLARLEVERDDGWAPVALAFGLAGSGPVRSPAAMRTAAGSQERSRPNQEARESGCWRSRSLSWRGAQVSAPPSGPDPTAAGRQGRRGIPRRPAGARPNRPGRFGRDRIVSALRRPSRALDDRHPLARPPSSRRR